MKYTIGQIVAANEILVSDVAQQGIGLAKGISMEEVGKCINIFRDIPFESRRSVCSWVIAHGDWSSSKNCHLEGLMYAQSLDVLRPGTKWPDPVGRMLAQSFHDNQGHYHLEVSFQESS